jgi:hypothetical protein
MSRAAWARAAWIWAFVGPPGAPGDAATGELHTAARTATPRRVAIDPLNLTNNTH